MKTIKHLAFAFLTIAVNYCIQAQNTQLLPINCNTNFWTINADGYIQQWSLSNGTITGGDTILSGGGTSLSYCGNSNAPTFFSNSYTQIGITYYDPGSGWINIPTYNVVNNNGGHLNDQYYMVEGAVIQVVKYWDGVNLTTVDSLNGEFFAGAQDIGVDTLGQAWVFTGPVPSTVDSLKVYNQNGKIYAYSIQFNEIAYGSFFLNDTLYLGTLQDSIFSVIISGSTAQLGNPIPFPSNNFTDMASCQEAESTTSIFEHPNTTIKTFPNPTSGYIMLPLGIERSSISVYNSQGQLIKLILNGQILDLTEQPSGMYFIKINGEGSPSFQKVMKL